MRPIVLGALYMLSRQTGMTKDQIEQFLGGFIYGMIDMDDLTKIETCLKDASTLEAEVEEAVADFEKGDLTDIIKGVELIGKMVGELPVDLGDCKDMQSDIARIEKWAQIFKDPTALVKVLIANVEKNVSLIEQDVLKTKNDIATTCDP